MYPTTNVSINKPRQHNCFIVGNIKWPWKTGTLQESLPSFEMRKLPNKQFHFHNKILLKTHYFRLLDTQLLWHHRWLLILFFVFLSHFVHKEMKRFSSCNPFYEDNKMSSRNIIQFQYPESLTHNYAVQFFFSFPFCPPRATMMWKTLNNVNILTTSTSYTFSPAIQ